MKKKLAADVFVPYSKLTQKQNGNKFKVSQYFVRLKSHLLNMMDYYLPPLDFGVTAGPETEATWDTHTQARKREWTEWGEK